MVLWLRNSFPELLGTPSKGYNLLVDTGSSDIWLFLDECQSDFCAGHNKYSPEGSSTYRGFGKVWRFFVLEGKLIVRGIEWE